jgi:hypothetical protein
LNNLKIITIGPHRYRPTNVRAKHPDIAALETLQDRRSRMTVRIATDANDGGPRLNGIEPRVTGTARRTMMPNLEQIDFTHFTHKN